MSDFPARRKSLVLRLVKGLCLAEIQLVKKTKQLFCLVKRNMGVSGQSTIIPKPEIKAF